MRRYFPYLILALACGGRAYLTQEPQESQAISSQVQPKQYVTPQVPNNAYVYQENQFQASSNQYQANTVQQPNNLGYGRSQNYDNGAYTDANQQQHLSYSPNYAVQESPVQANQLFIPSPNQQQTVSHPSQGQQEYYAPNPGQVNSYYSQPLQPAGGSHERVNYQYGPVGGGHQQVVPSPVHPVNYVGASNLVYRPTSNAYPDSGQEGGSDYHLPRQGVVPAPSPSYAPAPHLSYATVLPPSYPAAPSPNYAHAPSPSYATALPPSFSPSHSPSYAPTPSPSYASAPSPSYATALPPSYSPAPSPSYATALPPSYAPTPSPSYASAPSPSYATALPPSYSPAPSPSYATALPPSYSPAPSPSYATALPPSYSPAPSPSYATALPPQPDYHIPNIINFQKERPELKATKYQNFEAFKMVQLKASQAPPNVQPVTSKPSTQVQSGGAPLNPDGTVADTPEVKAAKELHFTLVKEAAQRAAQAKSRLAAAGQNYDDQGAYQASETNHIHQRVPTNSVRHGRDNADEQTKITPK